MLLRQVIGSVLRRIRLRQGRTLQDVARAAGVSTPYLSELERGRKEPSSEILASICRALGVPLEELLQQVLEELSKIQPTVVPAPLRGVARGRLPVLRGGADAAGRPDRATSRRPAGRTDVPAARRAARARVVRPVGWPRRLA